MFPDNARYRKLVARGKPDPEARLPPAMVGAVAIPIGMFWFAWTNGPNHHWLISLAAQVPFGFGFVLVYLSIQAYLVDSYTIYAASVLASNVLLRSGLGAAFPMFTSVSLCSIIDASLICSTCIMGWACTGHRQFQPFSHWHACHYPSFSTSMAYESAVGVVLRGRQGNRSRPQQSYRKPQPRRPHNGSGHLTKLRAFAREQLNTIRSYCKMQYIKLVISNYSIFLTCARVVFCLRASFAVLFNPFCLQLFGLCSPQSASTSFEETFRLPLSHMSTYSSFPTYNAPYSESKPVRDVTGQGLPDHRHDYMHYEEARFF